MTRVAYVYIYIYIQVTSRHALCSPSSASQRWLRCGRHWVGSRGGRQHGGRGKRGGAPRWPPHGRPSSQPSKGEGQGARARGRGFEAGQRAGSLWNAMQKRHGAEPHPTSWAAGVLRHWSARNVQEMQHDSLILGRCVEWREGVSLLQLRGGTHHTVSPWLQPCCPLLAGLVAPASMLLHTCVRCVHACRRAGACVQACGCGRAWLCAHGRVGGGATFTAAGTSLWHTVHHVRMCVTSNSMRNIRGGGTSGMNPPVRGCQPALASHAATCRLHQWHVMLRPGGTLCSRRQPPRAVQAPPPPDHQRVQRCS